MRRFAPEIVALGMALALALAVSPAAAPQRLQRFELVSTTAKGFISYDDARPVIEALRQSLPAELRGQSSAEREAAWPGGHRVTEAQRSCFL